MKKENNIIKLEDYKQNDEFFIEDQYYELMEKAYSANTEAKAKKYAKEALKLCPDNIDAKLFLLDFEEDMIKKLETINKFLKEEKKKLDLDNYFDKENIGDFWLIYETRSYMRMLNFKIDILVNLNRYSEAIKDCEYALKLCKIDNLGIRYILLELYCLLEKNSKFLELLQKFDDNSTEFLLLKSVFYFKKGDYNLSKKLITDLKIANPVYLHLFLDYDPNTLGEYVNLDYLDEVDLEDLMYVATHIIIDHAHLFSSAPYYNEFVKSCYNKR